MTAGGSQVRGPSRPYLEHCPEHGEDPHRILLEPLPFIIGRAQDANHTIYSRRVSKAHAEIFRAGESFGVRDLGSTNGTYVNGERVEEVMIRPGDVLHVAHKEFSFVYDDSELEDADLHFDRTMTEELGSAGRLFRAGIYLQEMLTDRRAHVVFQPIIDLADESVYGFEALGRGSHAELAENPGALFELADEHGLASDLSQLFRRIATSHATYLPGGARLFVNLHPAETCDDTLIQSLKDLRAVLIDSRRLVLEVHESAVPDRKVMAWMRDRLRSIDVELAYDDFGAGQARLMELVDVPPDFIKLDMALIRGIDSAAPRQDLIFALNRVATDIGIQVIAEGIETTEEARVCRELGCKYGQGYLFGRPSLAPQDATS